MSKRCHPAESVSESAVLTKKVHTILPITVPPESRDAHDNVDEEEDGEE